MSVPTWPADIDRVNTPDISGILLIDRLMDSPAAIADDGYDEGVAMTTAIADRVETLERQAALTHEDVAQIVGTTARTVGRWIKGTASPQRVARQRVVELAYVTDELARVIKPEERNIWLFSPNRLLGHDTPADRINQGDYRSVVALVEALADGVVV